MSAMYLYLVYKNPQTLGSKHTNYKQISFGKNNSEKLEPGSTPGGNCALCGNFGKHNNMVKSCKIITTAKGKQIKLWQNLNCKNYGIYVAQCEICQKQYVGQTKNTFSTRWNTHRAVWKKFDLRCV